METRTPLHTEYAIFTYADTLVYSLITYALKNRDFSAWFTTEILSFPHTKNISPQNTIPTVPIAILSETQAVQRAVWLFDALQHAHILGHERATATLVGWAHTREKTEPKMAILGLKYGVLNFGIWGHPLKKDTPIHILIQNTVYSASDSTRIAKQCVCVTNKLLEQALLTTRGNVYRLEPEMHDWLFGEKHIVLHTGTARTLTSIVREAERFSIPTALLENNAEVAYVALSPTCSLTDFTASEKLESRT